MLNSQLGSPSLRRESSNAMENARQEMLRNKIAFLSMYAPNQSMNLHDSIRRTHSLSKQERKSIKQMNKQFLEQNPS